VGKSRLIFAIGINGIRDIWAKNYINGAWDTIDLPIRISLTEESVDLAFFF